MLTYIWDKERCQVRVHVLYFIKYKHMYCLSSYLNGLNGFEYFESVEEMQHDKL